jgi:penicillin amidase
MKTLRRVLLGAAAGLGLVVVGGAGLGYWRLRASLPLLDGETELAGLAADVRVERDALGVPSLIGTSRNDVARALGFLHAQDRFFQMDLQRRRAAGELSEIFGPAALPLDRPTRRHRLRLRARRALQASEGESRALMEAYAAGVNAGLAALGARPFEYLLLRETPAAWRPEDSFLTAYAMFLQLNDENGDREAMLQTLHDTLPEPLFAFLAPQGTEWDAPIAGGLAPAVPPPGPHVVDLRALAKSGALDDTARGARTADADPFDLELKESQYGSNSWAVDAAHSAGGAMLANDMHLGLNVPNIWYRALLAWGSGALAARVVGVTLPGVPMVVVGSNTKVAWGFTNTTGDWSDLVVLEPGPQPDSYMTPDGPRQVEHALETIAVKGGSAEVLDVPETIWGPIVRKDIHGRRLAVKWIGHDVEALRFRFPELERVQDVDEAVRVASGVGAPPQNFVCADSKGRIAWTVLGRIPRRVGFDGRLPTSWADGSRRWDGWLQPAEYPKVVDPPQGRLWTANGRVVDGEELAKIGEGGGYEFGARQRQIRDDLLAIEKATPRDLLGVQLDNRAVFLARWRKLMLDALTPQALLADPRRRELLSFVDRWGGRAAVDSVGYRAVRAFRSALARQSFAPLVMPAKRADPDLNYLGLARQWEAPLWALVSERPEHLLDPRFKTWDDALLAAIDTVIADFSKDGAQIASRTWGEANSARIQHALSRAVPQLARFLDMPQDPLPGDSNMPRVLSQSAGASERLVVSPGREAEGIFEMPGGQSGHPLSEYYRKGHEAWLRGEPTPLLPGPAVHVLTLRGKR